MTFMRFPSGEEMHLDMAANQPRDKAGKFASTGGGGATPSVAVPLLQKGAHTATLKFAHEVGKGLASSGAALNEVYTYLNSIGVARDSVSGKRILKAYHEQQAKG